MLLQEPALVFTLKCQGAKVTTTFVLHLVMVTCWEEEEADDEDEGKRGRCAPGDSRGTWIRGNRVYASFTSPPQSPKFRAES